MGKMTLLHKIEKYQKEAPGNLALFAVAMGYRGPNTIAAWLVKSTIPPNKVSEVIRFFVNLKKGGKRGK